MVLIFGPFALIGLALALSLNGQWDFVGGMAVGAAVSAALWAREPPAFIEAYRSGFEGERQTARDLADLPAPWRVIHDVPADRSNRDHIVVGPGGLFLIDSKNLNGEVTIAGDQLTVSRFGISAFDYRIPQGRWARAAAFRLHDDLRREFGSSPRVNPVVALWCKFPARRTVSNRVAYLHGRELTNWLRVRPDVLSEEDVAAWAVRLERFARKLRESEEPSTEPSEAT